MGRCETLEAEIRCRRAGGVVGFPLDQVASIEKQEVPTYGSPMPGRPGADDPPASPTLAIDAAPGIAGEPAAREILDRIEQLTASISGGGSDSATESARRSLAAMNAYLGNLAARSGDYEEAEARYRRALDHDPALPVARLNLSAVLITIDRHDAAESILLDVLSGNPGDPRALELLGEAAFQRGRTDEAIEWWRKAIANGAGGGLPGRLEKALMLKDAEEGFQETGGGRFALRYDGEEASPELAREILAHLEQAHADLSGRLGHYPGAVIQVILYSRSSFHEVTGTPDWVGGIFDGQVRIPIRGLNHLTPQARHVLMHELTHSFVASKTRGSAPRWIQEGVAQLMEGRSAAREKAAMAAGYAAGGGDYATSFDYAKSLSQIEFLVEGWSSFHLNDLLDHLGRGTDIDSAMKGAIGLSYGEFLTAWGNWLTR